VDSAAQDVQAAINATAGQLPPTMPNPPIHRKTNPADTPVLMLALTSETLPLTKVSDYANSICKRHIEMTPLCKIEVTHLRDLGSREVRRGGVVDEQARVQPS
jgi:hypothetical protein